MLKASSYQRKVVHQVVILF
ncbi:hypothetical protein KUCAC02_025376 [Chaenocephalus aceratus]|uniref:Uncharacterized protein n=1 Tax=Chaenocephalus aceratus TaxID=36190 RepID=A0ACB9VV41_CHAAC|nr:hypothetical protein KUCAC02_025376 [Chaenocephalus aceratus]